MADGGFLYSQGNGEGYGDSSRPERIWSTRSLLVKHIDQAVDGPDDTVETDGARLDHIRLAGSVREVSSNTGFTKITLDDITGSIDTSLRNAYTQTIPEIQVGKYAVLYGQLMTFGGNRRFAASSIKQEGVTIETILHHEIEALREHLHHQGRLDITAKDGKVAEASSQANGNTNSFLLGDGNFMERVSENVPTDEPGITAKELARQLGVDIASASSALMALEEKGSVWKASEDSYVRYG